MIELEKPISEKRACKVHGKLTVDNAYRCSSYKRGKVCIYYRCKKCMLAAAVESKERRLVKQYDRGVSDGYAKGRHDTYQNVLDYIYGLNRLDSGVINNMQRLIKKLEERMGEFK